MSRYPIASGLECPYCGKDRSKVVDKRRAMRVRECLACHERWGTQEIRRLSKKISMACGKAVDKPADTHAV